MVKNESDSNKNSKIKQNDEIWLTNPIAIILAVIDNYNISL